MERRPEVTTLEAVQKRAGYQSLEPVTRPPWWGVDLDLQRRPGVVSLRQEPRPLPHSRFPPTPQKGPSASLLHGRPNKPMPPVFGTAQPLQGLAGGLRRFAARYPDHLPRYWLLKLASDRVELWSHRMKRVLPIALPIAAGAWLGRQRMKGRAEVEAEIEFTGENDLDLPPTPEPRY